MTLRVHFSISAYFTIKKDLVIILRRNTLLYTSNRTARQLNIHQNLEISSQYQTKRKQSA
jgi:hypothetical protein